MFMIGNVLWVFTFLSDNAAYGAVTTVTVTSQFLLTAGTQFVLPKGPACALHVPSISRVVALSNGKSGTVSMMVIDPATNAVQEVANDAFGTTEFGYMGLALHPPSGYVYAIPYNATRVLAIKPTAADPSTWEVTAVGPTFASGGYKWRGGVYEPLSGDVIGKPYQDTRLLRITTYAPSVIATTKTLALSNVSPLSNIVSIPNAAATLANVAGFTYETGGYYRGAGLLAANLAPQFPDGVATLPGGSQAIDYAAVCGLLVNAVNELSIRVMALEAPPPG